MHLEKIHIQAFSFLVGRLCVKLVIKHTPIDTKWSGLLYQNQGMVSKVTVELFIDVFHYNTYAGEMMVAAERMMVKLLLR